MTKFSTVLGTTKPNMFMTISPASFPSMSMEKVTVCVAVYYMVRLDGYSVKATEGCGD